MIYRKVYSVFFKNEKYLSKTLLTRRIPPTFRLCPAKLGSVCPQLFLLWYLDPVAVIHTISSLEVEEVSCGAAVF